MIFVYSCEYLHRRRARSGRPAMAGPIICQNQNLKYPKMIFTCDGLFIGVKTHT